MASLTTFRTSSHSAVFILSVFNPPALYTRGYKKKNNNDNNDDDENDGQ